MLTIHLGMPKTATSALQTLLMLNQTALAESGICYPDTWRGKGGKAHHGLANTLIFGTPDDVNVLIGEVTDYAAANSDKDIILSSEILTNALTRKRVGTLLRLVDSVSAQMPVRMVITMRRMDDFFESMYLHSTKHGNYKKSIEVFVEERQSWVTEVFSVIANLRQSHDIDIIPYQKSGDFLKTLIAGVGIPMSSQLLFDHETVMNTKLGIKAQTVLFNLDHVNKSSGLDLKRLALFRDMEAGNVSFEDDKTSYRILPHKLAKMCHEHALDMARLHNIEPYSGMHANANIKDYRHDTLDADNIEPADLERLRAWADRSLEDVPSTAKRASQEKVAAAH